MSEPPATVPVIGSTLGGRMALTAAALRTESAQLRALEWSYRRIAVRWQRAYGLNARVAFRLARGWTQDEAARRWNERWPSCPKSGKTFSYWETWPARGGRTPSPRTLDRLAELYRCRPGDLLDGVDYGALDTGTDLDVDVDDYTDYGVGADRHVCTCRRVPGPGGRAPVETGSADAAASGVPRTAAGDRIDGPVPPGLAAIARRRLAELVRRWTAPELATPESAAVAGWLDPAFELDVGIEFGQPFAHGVDLLADLQAGPA
jgi:transcriptional regulator with XRE-family HTH domain